MAEDKARDLQLRLSELQQENQAVLESLEIQLHMEQKAKEGLSQQLEAARNQIGKGTCHYYNAFTCFLIIQLLWSLSRLNLVKNNK